MSPFAPSVPEEEFLSFAPLLQRNVLLLSPPLPVVFFFTLCFSSADMAQTVSNINQNWPGTNMLLTVKKGKVFVCMCVFEGHFNNQPTSSQ